MNELRAMALQAAFNRNIAEADVEMQEIFAEMEESGILTRFFNDETDDEQHWADHSRSQPKRGDHRSKAGARLD